MKKSLLLLASILFAAALTSCSSAPKRTMQISTIYKNITTTLEAANSSMISGHYEQAEIQLASAYKSSMSIDNYDLLTTVCLSYVSLYLSFEEPDLKKASAYMTEAYLNADYAANSEKLRALCALNDVRLQLMSQKTDYSEYLLKLSDGKKRITKDPYNEALFRSVEGDVYRQKEDFKNAEVCYNDAINIFTKNRYLGEIGINWYKLAQVRSLSGNKQGAVDAMLKAIKYDRDAENSIALGTDYYALGLILSKGSPSIAERSQAIYSFRHSAQIFESIGLKKQAERSLSAIIN